MPENTDAIKRLLGCEESLSEKNAMIKAMIGPKAHKAADFDKSSSYFFSTELKTCSVCSFFLILNSFKKSVHRSFSFFAPQILENWKYYKIR